MRKKTDSVEAESWNAARLCVETFGDVPATFSVPIRTLIGDADRGAVMGEATMSDASRFLLGRLLRSPTFRAPYLGAARLNAPKTFEGQQGIITGKMLIRAFDPLTHAACLYFIYGFHRIHKLATPEDGLRFVTTPLQESMQVGAYVGLALPGVGLGAGLMLGGFRYLGLALLTLGDEPRFKQYRRHLKAAGLTFDSAWEQTTWGCNSIQVGALLLQAFGFGVTRTDAILLAAQASGAAPLRNAPLALAFHVAWRWIEFLKVSGVVPEFPLAERAVIPVELRPGPKVIEALETRVQNIPELEKSVRWLELTKGDVDLMSYLSGGAAPAGTDESGDAHGSALDAGDEDGPPDYGSLSADIKERFTQEEYDSLADAVREEIGSEEDRSFEHGDSEDENEE